MRKYLANALANRILFVLLFIVFINNSLAQTYPNQELLDNIVYAPYIAPTNELPTYLESFNGNTYGNSIIRVSDADVFNTTSQRIRHNYAVDQVWNSDGSLLKLAGYPAAILDGETYEFLYWSDIPGYGRWSNTQPNIIYGTEGNRFVSHDVSVNQSITLRTFSEYTDIDFGYGEGNQDANDKYVGLIAENNSGRFFMIYDIQEDIIIGTRQVPSGDLDWFTVSTNGAYAIASWRANGNGQTQGIKRYNLELTTETHLYDYSEHGDFGIDANGNEVYVQYGDETSWSNEYYITMIRIDNGEVTPLFHWSQSEHGSTGIWGGHISCRNLNRPGWAYVSEQCCPEHPVASKEIFAIKLDGTGTIERYAKHHNNITPGNGHSTQAVPSRDGTKVLFASNWNNSELMSNPNPPAWVVEVPQGSDEETVEVIANAGEDVIICEGETVILTASGGDSYLWSTGETTASIEVQPNETNEFQVTVSIGEVSDIDSVLVTVNPLPVVNAGDDASICDGDSITLTASGGATYLWNTGETTSSITVSPEVTTIYTVVATQNNCTSEDEVTVTVLPRQTINAGNDVTITTGESITLNVDALGDILWNNGETNSTITVSPQFTTTYSVTAFHNGCESYDSVTVFVEQENELDVFAGDDQTICFGDTIVLTVSTGDSYLWNTGETTQSIEVSPETTTNYSVTVTQGELTGSDSVLVTVNEMPEANVSSDVIIELGDTVILSASGGSEYLWSTGEVEASITVSPVETSTYTVTVFENNCFDEESVTVTVEEPFLVSAGEDMDICRGETVILSVTEGESYLWSTGETTQSIEVSPSNTSTYYVTVTNGTSTSNDSVKVFVSNCNGSPSLDVDNPQNRTIDLSVYPNPTKEIINVKLSGITNITSIRLFDITGKVLINDAVMINAGDIVKTYNLEDYNRGIYVLTVTSNGYTSTKRIVLK